MSILRKSSAAASPDHRLKNHAPSPPFGVLTVRRSERPPHCQKMVLFILTTSFFQSERVRICTSHGAATIGETALLVSKAVAHLVRPRCLVYCLPIPAPLVLSRRRPHADGSGVWPPWATSLRGAGGPAPLRNIRPPCRAYTSVAPGSVPVRS